MADLNVPRLGRRPVFIASYAPAAESLAHSPLKDETPDFSHTESSAGPKLLRDDFPGAGTSFEGGSSDGYRYRVLFAAGRLETSYELLRQFLREQGYGDVPLPANAAELRRFRLPPRLRHQLSLFGDNGYVHNPVKVLFPIPAGHRGGLILEVYNERAPDHLLRFHQRL